jgi:hypothetical protein
MKKYELDALRDFAIEHLPMAQRQREQAKRFGNDVDGYCRALVVAAMHTRASATASAIENQAARLLEQLMLLALEHGYEGIEDTIVEAVHDLASLTSTSIPWLPDRQEAPPSQQRVEPQAEPQTTPSQPETHPRKLSVADLFPGQLLTTEEAASALGRRPNTLRTWASKETGDVQPVSKVGREHRWSADDIIALLKKR